ncbi:hypothetical protein ACFU9Y_10610 [Streptomyces sp. NPDC057621]|uniref:hypothetical protein n=1 Tax=Streptomyces sp. NPDC057621 TaxID=3346186 RepID=UPI00368FC793
MEGVATQRDTGVLGCVSSQRQPSLPRRAREPRKRDEAVRGFLQGNPRLPDEKEYGVVQTGLASPKIAERRNSQSPSTFP